MALNINNMHDNLITPPSDGRTPAFTCREQMGSSFRNILCYPHFVRHGEATKNRINQKETF